jgi:hypothetical protein
MDKEDKSRSYDTIARTLQRLEPKVPERGHDHHEPAGPQTKATSIRQATHRGHEIEVVTTYEFKIDGKPVFGHFQVDDAGKLHCHDLPNYAFSSAVELGKRLIDLLPEDEVEDELNETQTHDNPHQHGKDG